MNATIGVYNNHELAVAAVQKMKDSNFPVELISIMGMAEEEVVDSNMNLTKKMPIAAGTTKVATTTAIGTALGILTGVGIFAIPGLGFLYGAGALVGAIGGLDIGLMGGVVAVLATVGVQDESAKKYHDSLSQGKFLVIVHGSQGDVNAAKDILHTHGTHNEQVALH